MSKSRVYEIAKELNVDSKLIIEKLKAMDVDVKNHMSSITEAEAAKVKQAFQKPAPKQPEKPKMEAKPEAVKEQPKTDGAAQAGAQNRNNSYRENGKRDMTQKSGQKPQNNQSRPAGGENRE